MGQVLSQSEVDALLSAVGDGSGSDTASEKKSESSGSEAQTQGDEGKPEVVVYDLTNQDRVIRGRMPTLDIVYERFIRLFRISLSNSLRKVATISIISTDLLKFGEFVNTLPIPSCMAIMRFESLHGPALLVFESKLAYALIDSYFGGTDRPFSKIEGKEFTNIELTILKKVMDLALIDLQEAWSPVHQSKISYVRTEVNPQFVGVVPPSDVIVSTTFEVELENASGTIAVIIPYSTLEPIKHKLNAAFQAESDNKDKLWTDVLVDHMQSVGAELSVNLGQTEITVADLLNLNVGDVLPLSQDADGELDLLIEGASKFKCIYGASRGNKAIQVTRSIEE